MRVEVERDAARKSWKVYVLMDGEQMRRWDPAATGPTFLDQWPVIEPGTAVEPSLVIEDEVWGPLATAILGLPTDQAPLADHLADARRVRDRLLTMVESAWPPPPRLLTADEAGQ